MRADQPHPPPLAFGRNRFGEMNGEFARSNRRFAPFYAKKGSSVTIVRPKRTHCKRVSAIECRVVQPAGGESVGVAPHRRCTVRNGAGLRPALKVKVWAAQPAPRASVRCPLPPSVVWVLYNLNASTARVALSRPARRSRLSIHQTPPPLPPHSVTASPSHESGVLRLARSTLEQSALQARRRVWLLPRPRQNVRLSRLLWSLRV